MQFGDQSVGNFTRSTRDAFRAAGRGLLVMSFRLVAAGGVAAFAMSAVGCYTYPSRRIADLEPAAVVAAQISDVGRVSLAEPLGSGVARIDGQVVQRNDSAIRLMVTQVRFLNGLQNRWQGQELTLRPLDVTSVSQRTFSRQRTVTVVIIGALATAALTTVGFVGLFSGEGNRDDPPDPPPET